MLFRNLTISFLNCKFQHLEEVHSHDLIQMTEWSLCKMTRFSLSVAILDSLHLWTGWDTCPGSYKTFKWHQTQKSDPSEIHFNLNLKFGHSDSVLRVPNLLVYIVSWIEANLVGALSDVEDGFGSGNRNTFLTFQLELIHLTQPGTDPIKQIRTCKTWITIYI